MENAKYAYVQATNSIGVILDKGTDNMGGWYRTDCDGVRDPMELLFLHTKAEVKRCAKQFNANISPSTKELIELIEQKI